MSYLPTTCPHCDTPQAPFASVAFSRRENTDRLCNGLFVCPICEKPIAVWVQQNSAVSGCNAPHELHKWANSVGAGGWVVTHIWPEAMNAEAPIDTPENIARNFVQAEDAAKRRHREAAGMAYRRALELTMKDKGPALKGTLEKRIDALATEGKLTADIAEWAHSIRTLGNEATHDEEEPTDEDVADLAAFTRVVLEYLYTMPAKVARRAGGGSEPTA